MLRGTNIHYGFNGARVLRGVSFSVPPGTLCGLLGPNGGGKTTLLKCCLRFLVPQQGSVIINGRDHGSMSPKQLARTAAYVPQEHKPPFPFKVKDMVLMGRTPHMRSVFGVSAEDKRKAYEAMDALDLLPLADKPCNQLSGGQRQMVLIARAAAQEARLLLLDEPTSALDFANQLKIWRLLREIADRGVTVIACTHDPNHIVWYCDKVVVLHNGTVPASGAPEDVLCRGLMDDIYGEDCCTIEPLGDTLMVAPANIASPHQNRNGGHACTRTLPD